MGRHARGHSRRGRERPLRRRLLGVLEAVAVITVAVLAWQAAAALRSAHYWPIRQVHVVGERAHLSTADIRQAMAPHVTEGFFTTDLSAIEAALEELPWTADAAVRRLWPDTLELRLRERDAVARWGKDGVLTTAGEVFYPRGAEIPQELPVLYGPDDSQRTLLARYRRMQRRLQTIGLGLRALVQDERRAWHLLLEGGIPLALGRGDPQARVARFIRAWPAVLAGRAEAVERIDLRYTNGFAVAWKPGAATEKEEADEPES